MAQPYEQLERDFGRWAGVENVVACSSGTAALHLALEALRLPPGSEVIVPDYGMIACPRAVTLAGLLPVFVDCGDDLLMDLSDMEDFLAATQDNELPAAIILVHVYGRTIDWKRFHQIVSRQAPGRLIIEDMAEAHGAKINRRTDAAAWSFYKNKIVAGEEGGAVAFRDPKHAAHARELRTLGFTERHDFIHTPRGHNYRMSNAHATLILDSLKNVEASVGTRRINEAEYDAVCPQEWHMPPRQAPWVYDIRIPGMSHETQRLIVTNLNAAGIAARHGFRPMSEQPEYKDCRVVGSRNASRIACEVFYLPLLPAADSDLAFSIIRKSIDSI